MDLKLRHFFLILLCGLLLPENIWVGNSFRLHSRRWAIIFGRMDVCKWFEVHASPRKRTALKIRFFFLRLLCGLLLPKDAWIGKTFGFRSRKWIVAFGRLNSRGVIQDATEEEIAETLGN